MEALTLRACRPLSEAALFARRRWATLLEHVLLAPGGRADAPGVHARAGAAPPRAARLLRGPDDPRAPGGPGRHRGRLRRRAGLPQDRPAAWPRRLAGPRVARAVRRARRLHAPPADLYRPGRGRPRAPAPPYQQPPRPHHHAARRPR